jgi:L-asparaginase
VGKTLQRGNNLTNKRVAIGSLGGTITMTASSTDSGVRPTLGAADLVSATPQLAEVATVSSTTLLRLPGASLTMTHLRDVLDWAQQSVDDGHDGVVLVQGTDTIEETSYFFDLHWDRRQPLIVTGAMRQPEAPSSDGPANLVSAVLVAADDASRGRGVLVVLNDQVHAASRVRKARASGVNAFESPSFGPLAYIEENRVVFGNTIDRMPPLPSPGPAGAAQVALLGASLGDRGELLQLAMDAEFDGAVIEGFGVGHVSEAFADVIAEAAKSRPIVLCSRTGSGTTFEKTYGFNGSESDLLARGAIGAGWLDGRKARILLCCLLAYGYGINSIRDEFRKRGQPFGGQG